jgi:hypothetical protein
VDAAKRVEEGRGRGKGEGRRRNAERRVMLHLFDCNGSTATPKIFSCSGKGAEQTGDNRRKTCLPSKYKANTQRQSGGKLKKKLVKRSFQKTTKRNKKGKQYKQSVGAHKINYLRSWSL